MKGFKEIACTELNDNIFRMIGKDWMLVTAGDKEDYNTMTASWGGVGVLWNKNVAVCYIRPQRYTFEFTEKSDYFSLAFFGGEYKKELGLCGSKSGRDIDKAEACGLTPCFDESAPYFKQASTVLICRKLYAQDFNRESFIDKELLSNYENGDYHRMYVGEIVKVLCAE